MGFRSLNADALSKSLHAFAAAELPPAAAFRLTIHTDLALLNKHLGFASGRGNSRRLQKCIKGDVLTAQHKRCIFFLCHKPFFYRNNRILLSHVKEAKTAVS